MPLLRIKVEGRGKMIKTVLQNLDEIAIALERPSDYILKFFGFEFGAPVAYSSDKYILGGNHKLEELAKALDVFISKYIVCGGCTNPETNLEIRKGNILLICRACSYNTQVDFKHKLTDYIVKKQSVPDRAKKTQPRVLNSNDPVEILRSFWSQKPSDEEILTKVQGMQSQHGWTPDQTLRTVFASLFDKHILTDLDSKADVLKLFVSSQKSQETTLFCIDKLCTMEKSVIPSVSQILGKITEKNIIEPANVRRWFAEPHPKIDKKVAKEIRNTAISFVEDLPPLDKDKE